MRYGYLIKKPYLDFGFQTKDSNRIKYENYFDSVFRRLLVYDQVSEDVWQKVIDEAYQTLDNHDQAFCSAISPEYLAFLKAGSYQGKWNKIRQDNNFLIKQEVQRRNKGNPYHNLKPREIQKWEDLPDFDRAYKNKSWQFEGIYKDINYFCMKLKAFIKGLSNEDSEKREAIRLKINSILAAEKIIFALETIGNSGDYLEGATNIVDIKLSLDGFKQADIFLEKSIESLHKMKWNMEGKKEVQEFIDSFISFSSQIEDELRKKIREQERRLIMFMNMESDHF